MDPLSDFLSGPRARGAFLLRVIMRPPWSMSVVDEAPLSVVPLLTGQTWFRPGNGPEQHLRAGDVLVVRSPTSYVLATESDMSASITIGAGQECSGADGRDLSEELSSGVRTWGNDPAGSDCMLVGAYRSDGEVGRILLEALPPYLVVHDPAPHITELLNLEIVRDEVGQGGVLDRLLDLLLIATLRKWLEEASQSNTWMSSGRDPEVHSAVKLIHGNPDHPWTVQSLAAAVGLSRAALARRFHSVVGAPPMAYLTQWRLARGADLLEDEAMTLAAIARSVGYSSPFSFSTAFKQHYGVSPQKYRARS